MVVFRFIMVKLMVALMMMLFYLVMVYALFALLYDSRNVHHFLLALLVWHLELVLILQVVAITMLKSFSTKASLVLSYFQAQAF